MTHSFAPVVPGNLIHAQDLNQVINALDGLAAAGVPIVLTALSDPSNFALSVQNLESSNSRALLVLKSDGTQLVRVDVNGVTLGAPLNLATQSINGNALENGTVPNAALGPDVARANLLTNGGFENWQRGNGPYTAVGVVTADRWISGAQGTDTLSVSKDTTNMDAGGSQACAACTFTLGTGAGTSVVYQQIHVPTDDYQLAGATLSFSVRVRTSTANAVRIGLNNYTSGSNWTYSAYHPGDGAYHTLTVTATMSASIIYCQPAVFFAASTTAYIDNACLVVGSQPANYVPLHPADDLARCLRYFQVIGGGTNSRICVAHAYATNAALGVVNYVQKPVTPTLTANGAFVATQANGTQVAATLAASSITARDAEIDATTSGMVAGNATMLMAGSGLLSSFNVEANP